ncbi:MAG: alanine--tRNA ligase, partial [candidate division Zixibacteria bacterium]|nr:alanine--tRNA ligase [candidate division Zixibacteria bacterium]
MRDPKIKTSEIRQAFLDFFKARDHRIVPSSPVIPFDDPTILFTNAGMNQFKDVFTGRRKIDYKRAASSQKCIRAGGKHNDLDNVGFTARHHTFFEMLGNFSFGDYFKEEAIQFHWELMTKTFGLPKERLYASVYETDDDAFALWEKIAPELKNGRILRFGKKDNYWSMGNIGPCGPCSEIHFDRGEKFGAGPDDVVNGETERFVEIGNLVFMQFDQQPDGTIVGLPKPSVDTGSGLERIAAVVQHVDSNYGIDLFQSLIAAISDVTSAMYADHVVSHHVIADHLRALTFALADGAGISNEGQGYVLRRILRRAARHGRLLGMHEPFIYSLVPTLVDAMGEAFPEIREKQSHIQNVIKVEEESFLRTLETGLHLFEQVANKVRSTGGTVIDGDDVFKLCDTYGFPYDLTEIIAREQGLTLDQTGFDKCMAWQREQSKAMGGFDTLVGDTSKRYIDEMERNDVLRLVTTSFNRRALS